MVHPNPSPLDSPDFLPYVLAQMIVQQNQLPHAYNNHHLAAQQLQLQQQYQQQHQQHQQQQQQQQQQLLHQLQLYSLQQQQLRQLQLQQQQIQPQHPSITASNAISAAQNPAAALAALALSNQPQALQSQQAAAVAQLHHLSQLNSVVVSKNNTSANLTTNNNNHLRHNNNNNLYNNNNNNIQNHQNTQSINSVKNLNNQYKSSIFESIAALAASSSLGTSGSNNNINRRSSPSPVTPPPVQSQPSSTNSSSTLATAVNQCNNNNTKDHQNNALQVDRLLSQTPSPSPKAASLVKQNLYKVETLPSDHNLFIGGQSNKRSNSSINQEQSAKRARFSISSLSSTEINNSDNNNQSSSAAINSLTNFVTDALAPILNTTATTTTTTTNTVDNDKSSPSKHYQLTSYGGVGGANGIKEQIANFDFLNTTGNTNNNKSTNSSGTKQNNFNSNGNRNTINQLHQQHRRSSSIESGDDEDEAANRNSTTTTTTTTLDLISSAAQSLKAGVVATGTTINATLAKAPPELVKKQPAWVFCTRYSDRPSSGPRTRRAKSKQDKKAKDPKASADEKRPRTAFTSEQLDKLRQEFQENSYLDEKRRKDLAERLCLNENQIKIWFQNKRAKIKKQNNQPNPLRGLLVAGGLYNHSTATSDCSESYANGNDHDQNDHDDPNDDCMDSNDIDDI